MVGPQAKSQGCTLMMTDDYTRMTKDFLPHPPYQRPLSFSNNNYTMCRHTRTQTQRRTHTKGRERDPTTSISLVEL